MFKFFLRWMDSWSLTDTLDKQHIPFQESSKDTKIQWFRILPFILLHIACLAVFGWVCLGLLSHSCCFFILFVCLRSLLFSSLSFA
jgi:stearoyl-CoA desaturase (delta-9 desaturase)